MKLKKGIFLIILVQLFFSFFSFGQPNQKLITVQVTPTKPNWTYKLNEEVGFEVKVLRNGNVIKDIEIGYKIGSEQMPAHINGKKLLEDGKTIIKTKGLNQPGFLRCNVWVSYKNNIYDGWGTAGFKPDEILPTVSMPNDFDEFWGKAKEELLKVPIDAIITLKPELCTSNINVYHVNLQNIEIPNSWLGNTRFYGMLSVPKKHGKYPAILQLPGAGVRGYGRDDRAAKDVIVFKVGIHGIPVDMDSEVYTSLEKGALYSYSTYNLHDKNLYYYKRVYMGCIRAVDFINTLPEYDGENLAVNGGSQGGALSIVTAALDSRVKYLAVFYPALSDLTGYLENRAGGWPHMFKHFDKNNTNWIKTTAYYDIVNFARILKIPGWYSWGFNDNVCPPTSMYAAYNVITAPKKINLYLETAHWTYPEQWDEANDWLIKKLKTKN